MSSNIIFTIVIASLCIIKPKSKIVCIAFFFFMWTLWAFNVWNGDYIAYMNEYYEPAWETVEVGYRLICKICSLFLPYQGFLILTSGIILFTFCYLCIKYSNYSALYSLFYFPIFILEFVFLRNYISLVLICYALFRIIFDHRSIKISLILIFVASTIHVFSICFLPIVMLLKSNINYRSLILIVTLFCLLSFIASHTVIQSSAYLESKTQFYARAGGNTISLTTPFHIIIVCISFYIFRHSKIINNKLSNTFKYFNNYNILSLIMIAVYFILPYAASRSLRILIFINYLYYLNLLCFSTKNTKIFSKLGLIFMAFCIGYFFIIQNFDFVLLQLYKFKLICGYDAAYQLASY